MPTYHYECSDCGHRFDKIRPMDERKTANCPSCRYGVGEQKITPVNGWMAGDSWAKQHEERGTPLRGTGKPRPQH